MESLLYMFLIIGIGYLLGKISIKGISLGNAFILMVALVFGHFGIVMDPLIGDLGLVLFVGSVGLIAGPVFIKNFENQALSFILMGVIIVGTGIVVTFVTSKILGISSELSMGILTGALTSTPGLAAAQELDVTATAASEYSISGIGYGITYVFGVVGVVLFVQLVPKLLKRNMKEEVALFKAGLQTSSESEQEDRKSWKEIESSGLLVFSLAMVIGILIGLIKVPLPGGGTFSIGATGGTLFAGLVIGHIRHLGKYSIEVPSSTLHTLQEVGLVLFLARAGSDAGQGFVEIVSEHGVVLFLQGALVTLLPMLVASFVALKILKLNLLTVLGSICGGMTSTPALGTLVNTTKTEEVAVPYAATYPVGMIMVILGTQILNYFI